MSRENAIRAGVATLALLTGLLIPIRPLAALDHPTVVLQPGEAVTVQAAAAGTPPPTVAPVPTAQPSPTSAPSVAPSVTPTPAVTLSPTPSAVPTPSCPANLQGAIDAAPAGSTLVLTGCAYGSSIAVNKPLTLIGATIRDTVNVDPYKPEISVGANDVTIDGFSFLDGGVGVSIYGFSRVSIKHSTFRGMRGGAVAMWANDNDILIEGNDILQTEGFHVSPIAGRGSEGSNPCPVTNKRTTIRNNIMDQGPQPIGWFGIELKCHEDALIEGNRLAGGEALVSLPDSNRVMVRNNDFAMKPSNAYWGVEIAKANDVTVTGNRFVGITGWGDAVAMNSGSLRAVITFNNAHDMHSLVNGGGGGTLITDNCVLNLTALRVSIPAGSTDTVLRNGPC